MSGVKSSLLGRAGHFLHRFLSEVTASVIVTASIAGATTAYLHYSNNQPTTVAPMAPAVLASAPASAPAAPAKPIVDLSGMLTPAVADPSVSQLQPVTTGKVQTQAQFQPAPKPAASSSQWRRKVVAVLAKTARKPETTTAGPDPLISTTPAAPLTPPDRSPANAAPRPAPTNEVGAPKPASADDNGDPPLLPPALVPQITLNP